MNFSTLSTVRLLWSPGLARVLWAGGNWLVTIYFTLEKESSLLYACICDLVDLYSIGFSQESTAPVLQPITNVLILRILWVWASASLDGCGVAFPLAIPTSICRSKVSPCLSSNAATFSAIPKVAQGRAALSPRFDRADGSPDK